MNQNLRPKSDALCIWPAHAYYINDIYISLLFLCCLYLLYTFFLSIYIYFFLLCPVYFLYISMYNVHILRIYIMLVA